MLVSMEEGVSMSGACMISYAAEYFKERRAEMNPLIGYKDIDDHQKRQNSQYHRDLKSTLEPASGEAEGLGYPEAEVVEEE